MSELTIFLSDSFSIRMLAKLLIVIFAVSFALAADGEAEQGGRGVNVMDPDLHSQAK